MKYLLLFCSTLLLTLQPAEAQRRTRNTKTSKTAITKPAQESKTVRALKQQKEQLQNNLKKSQRDLDRTRSDVNKGQKTIRVLEGEINTRVEFIHRTQYELDTLNRRIDTLQRETQRLDSILAVKKRRFTQSLRMAQAYRKVNSSLLFALSASDITQMYRRLRYTREYAAHQRAQGEAVQQQTIIVLEHQNRVLAMKSEANQKMQVLISERAKLARQQAEEQQNVNKLQKKAGDIKKQIDEQNRQIVALQKKIDQVIAYEIEQARKRAEAEARRKAEAERRAAAERRKSGAKSSGSASGAKSGTKNSSASSISASKWLTAEDQKLNGNFQQNKGRLPVPITGPYRVGVHYGSNTSRNLGVVLQNKGVNYVGQAGAKARSVFDGEVSAVFSLGGMKNVLVRHGSFISVYCNLSSVNVKKGQQIKARDILGSIATDFSGNHVLHFQLRKETTRLNPEQWVGR